MITVSNQTDLDAGVAAGETRFEITGEWNKVIIRENVSIERLKISPTAKVGSVYISGTVTGSVDISGTVTGSVDIYGTAKVGKGLKSIRSDYFKILKKSVAEIPGLISALKDGRINGSVYEGGECQCLIGTLEKIRGSGPDSIVPRDSKRPAEQWFLAIPQGHTPKKNAFARLAVEWAEEFMKLQNEKALDIK